MKKLLFCLVFLNLIFTNCKNETKNTSNTTQTNSNTTSVNDAKSKPEVYLYSVVTENLILRDQPNKQSNTLLKLGLKDFVTSTGELSKDSIDAKVNGLDYRGPFMKVTSTTPEQTQGWIFEPALTRVYAGSKANSPDLGKLTQLSTFLSTLPVKKLDSGQKAWAYVKNNYADVKGTTADAASILLMSFLNKMQFSGHFDALFEKIKFTDADNEAIWKMTFDGQKYPATKAAVDAGFYLASSEGYTFAVPDYRPMKAFWNDKVTPTMNQYLDLNIVEQHTYTDDGGIVIPLEELADRTVAWERFETENPYFTNQVSTSRFMENALLMGMNNTPVFDYEGKMLSEDTKKAWTYILQKYPDTRLGKNVKALSELVTAEKGIRTPKVDAFLEQFLKVF